MRVQKTYITDIDGVTHTYPLEEGEKNPELLEIQISSSPVDQGGRSPTSGAYGPTKYTPIHITKELAKKHGFFLNMQERETHTGEINDTESLLLELLESVGIVPNDY